MTGENQNKGSWHQVKGKYGKRQHFVLTGESFSLCNIHESHFGLGVVPFDSKKQCGICKRVLETYHNFDNRPTKQISIADNYRSHTHENFEFKWDGSRRYY